MPSLMHIRMCWLIFILIVNFLFIFGKLNLELIVIFILYII